MTIAISNTSGHTIKAKSDRFYAELKPSYFEPKPSELIINEDNFQVVVTSEGVNLTKGDEIICHAKELKRSEDVRVRRHIIVSSDSFKWALTQKIEGYVITDGNGTKLGNIKKSGITLSGLKGRMVIESEVDEVIPAFVGTLVGHLWKSEDKTHKILNKGGLTIVKDMSWDSKSAWRAVFCLVGFFCFVIYIIYILANR